MRRVVGLVLAAGGSRRLGRPKQLEPFLGTPLVRRVVEAVAGSSCVAVAAVLGANALEVARALDGAPVAKLQNESWRRGIASSIRAGVSWARGERANALLIALADQPLLDASHVDRLVQAWRDGARAVGSLYGGGLGVPAAFDASLFPELCALEGDRGAARLLRAHDNAVAVAWPEGEFDVDTEADALALAAVARRE
jgi:CTP:molybdopterin cytidylyltransferase MocA